MLRYQRDEASDTYMRNWHPAMNGCDYCDVIGEKTFSFSSLSLSSRNDSAITRNEYSYKVFAIQF